MASGIWLRFRGSSFDCSIGAPYLTPNLTFDKYCTVCRLSEFAHQGGANDCFPVLDFLQIGKVADTEQWEAFSEIFRFERERERERERKKNMTFGSTYIAAAPPLPL